MRWRSPLRGGAEVLGRSDIGSLEVGKCADVIALSIDAIEYAGALHDPVAALLFSAPRRIDHSFVQGKRVVAFGRLATLELGPVIEEHNGLARSLLG